MPLGVRPVDSFEYGAQSLRADAWKGTLSENLKIGGGKIPRVQDCAREGGARAGLPARTSRRCSPENGRRRFAHRKLLVATIC